MKEFCCGDVVPGCKTSFRADSEELLLQQIAAHARSAHGVTALSDGLVAEVRRHIRAA